jgi:hypothetical protein
MPTTIYTAALATSTAGYGGKTLRSEVPISAASLGQVRVTFAAPAAANLTTDHCSIGVSKQDSTGSTVATPVELTFAGVSGFNIAGGTSITSDWVNLSALVTDKLIVVCDINAAGNGQISYVPANIEYEKAATASWNTATVAGYTSTANTVGFNLIETQASGGGGGSARRLTLMGVG